MATATKAGQGGVRYPWKKWLQKRHIVLVRGKDFDCQPHSMAQQARNAAYRMDVRISTRVVEEKVIIARRANNA